MEQNALIVADTPALAAAVTREAEEIRAAIVTAKRFPRDEQAAIERLKKSMSNPKMARAGEYEIKFRTKSDKEIRFSGESIEFAKEFARQWGNIRFGFRVLANTSTQVHGKAYAIDLETNASVEREILIEKLIPRKNRDGSTQWIEPSEHQLLQMVNAQASKAIRNSILSLIPAYVAEEILEVMHPAIEKFKDERAAACEKLCAVFEKLGISRQMLEEKVDGELEDADEADLRMLGTLARHIRDGRESAPRHFRGAKEYKPQPRKPKPADVKTADQVEAEKKDSPTATNEKPKNESSTPRAGESDVSTPPPAGGVSEPPSKIELLSSMYAAFKPLGVTPEMIGAYLKANPAQCAPETLREMIELAESIKRGELSLAETFPGAKRAEAGANG